MDDSHRHSFQFSSVAQSCLTLCEPKDCSTPGFHVHHQLLELTQTHVHQIGDTIQPSHPLSDWKRSVFIPIPKKGNPKECSNYCTLPLISHASKVMLKILQARLQQYVNHDQIFKLVLEKAEEPEIKLPASVGS